MLPTPDVVLYERVLLSDYRTDVQSLSGNPDAETSGACDVLRLAARKAVGCGDDAAYEGPQIHQLFGWSVVHLTRGLLTCLQSWYSQLSPH